MFFGTGASAFYSVSADAGYYSSVDPPMRRYFAVVVAVGQNVDKEFSRSRVKWDAKNIGRFMPWIGPTPRPISQPLRLCGTFCG